MKSVFGILTLVAVCSALPLVLKEKKSDSESDVLDLLDLQDKLVQKFQSSKTEVVNGKTEKIAEIKEELKNSKNGETVATISKVETQKDGQAPKSETKIDIPAAGIHKTETSDDSEMFISPNHISDYIMQTGDVDTVQETFDNLLKDKRTNKEDLDEFAAQVLEQLKSSTKDEAPEESIPKEEKIEFNELLDLADGVENGETEAKQKIYNLALDLYMRSVEGDEYASELLTNYVDAIRDGPSLRIISEKTKDDILDVVDMALTDVNEYLNGDEEPVQKPKETENNKSEKKVKADAKKPVEAATKIKSN